MWGWLFFWRNKKQAMQPSDNCYVFIMQFEGLDLNAYKDPGSVDGLPITIGYGSTAYKNGRKIMLGDTITEEEAYDMLKFEVDKKAVSVNTLTKDVLLTQNQFDSLVSFAYNVGIGAFQKSTLLKKVKFNSNDVSIGEQFMRWTKNDGRELNGLVRRRKAEATLYFT